MEWSNAIIEQENRIAQLEGTCQRSSSLHGRPVVRAYCWGHWPNASWALTGTGHQLALPSPRYFQGPQHHFYIETRTICSIQGEAAVQLNSRRITFSDRLAVLCLLHPRIWFALLAATMAMWRRSHSTKGAPGTGAVSTLLVPQHCILWSCLLTACKLWVPHPWGHAGMGPWATWWGGGQPAHGWGLELDDL